MILTQRIYGCLTNVYIACTDKNKKSVNRFAKPITDIMVEEGGSLFCGKAGRGSDCHRQSFTTAPSNPPDIIKRDTTNVVSLFMVEEGGTNKQEFLHNKHLLNNTF